MRETTTINEHADILEDIAEALDTEKRDMSAGALRDAAHHIRALTAERDRFKQDAQDMSWALGLAAVECGKLRERVAELRIEAEYGAKLKHPKSSRRRLRNIVQLIDGRTREPEVDQ